MDNKEWLNNLKVGDEVYKTGKYGRIGGIYKISRITNTQIIIKINDHSELKFKKKDGFEITSDKWHFSNIIEPTNKIRSEIKATKLWYNLKNIMAELKYCNDIEALNKLINACYEYNIIANKKGS